MSTNINDIFDAFWRLLPWVAVTAIGHYLGFRDGKKRGREEKVEQALLLKERDRDGVGHVMTAVSCFRCSTCHNRVFVEFSEFEKPAVCPFCVGTGANLKRELNEI